MKTADVIFNLKNEVKDCFLTACGGQPTMRTVKSDNGLVVAMLFLPSDLIAEVEALLTKLTGEPKTIMTELKPRPNPELN